MSQLTSPSAFASCGVCSPICLTLAPDLDLNLALLAGDPLGPRDPLGPDLKGVLPKTSAIQVTPRFSGVTRKLLQVPTVLTVFIASKTSGLRLKHSTITSRSYSSLKVWCLEGRDVRVPGQDAFYASKSSRPRSDYTSPDH
jgi:hypothetical protein